VSHDLLVELGRWLCGQGRCLEVGGQALPLCQRCLGLYLGGGLTALWLLGTGLWRRGLPGFTLGLLQALALLVAMAGGLHLVDPGVRWRLLCGLWTGHVVLVWLVTAAAHLTWRARGAPVPPWRRWDRRVGYLALPLLAGLAAALPAAVRGSWLAWSWVALASAGLTILAGAAALAQVLELGLRRLTRRGSRP
jgi:hypothetical protein